MLMGGGDPEEGDPYQVAGDVVPGPVPRTTKEYTKATRPFQGSGGMESINRVGGVNSPYLDLLNILMYPQGGQIRK